DRACAQRRRRDRDAAPEGGVRALHAPGAGCSVQRGVPGVSEAKLVPAENGGVVPEGGGWVVLNAKGGRWLDGTFGQYCAWEGPDDAKFERLGVNLNVLHPGVPMAMYHREDNQEGFLVLDGECLAIVDGEERQLKQWDYFHCPGGVPHVVV